VNSTNAKLQRAGEAKSENLAMEERQHFFELAEKHTKGYGTICFGELPKIANRIWTMNVNQHRDVKFENKGFTCHGPQRSYRVYNPRTTSTKDVAALASQPLIRNTKEDALIVGSRGGAVDFSKLAANWKDGDPMPPLEYTEALQALLELINGHHRMEALLLKTKDELIALTALWKAAIALEKAGDVRAAEKWEQVYERSASYVERTRWLVRVIDVGEFICFLRSKQPLIPCCLPLRRSPRGQDLWRRLWCSSPHVPRSQRGSFWKWR
jgi:hypothetical protein